jgi:hypothetical protein
VQTNPSFFAAQGKRLSERRFDLGDSAPKMIGEAEWIRPYGKTDCDFAIARVTLSLHSWEQTA